MQEVSKNNIFNLCWFIFSPCWSLLHINGSYLAFVEKVRKSVDNPRKQNQTPPFPVSSFPPSRCCSISGRMLMPAAFLWCVTRSKTKLRHKHFLDPLILTLYVQYWSSTCQIVFAYVSHLTLTGPWYSRMLKLFAKVKHT